MVTRPPSDFLLLSATLLSNLPSSSSVQTPDTLLLQLYAIFGPMFMSALQLVDDREVVKVSLPGGRSIHQVTSSTGTPYTLHLNPPKRANPVANLDAAAAAGPSTESFRQDAIPTTDDQVYDASATDPPRRAIDQTYIVDLAASLEGLYCSCPGFAYNSLSGPGNPLCKHLLAVVVATCMGKEIPTTVELDGVPGLLGIGSGDQPEIKEEPA